MLSSTLFIASISALIAGTSAAPTINPNTRYGQLRIFPQAECVQPNLGELGIYGSDVGLCKTFTDDDIRSLTFESNPYGCELHTWSDLECNLDRHDVTTGECLSGDKVYRSYKLTCSS